MQGLQEIWNIDTHHSWAAAGYLGAISSGQTTCGLLIGSSIAIGLRYGKGKNCTPVDDENDRNKSAQEVRALYDDFIKKFKTTNCRELTQCDFSKPEDSTRYIEKEIYKDKCFVFFHYVMNRFIEKELKS